VTKEIIVEYVMASDEARNDDVRKFLLIHGTQLRLYPAVMTNTQYYGDPLGVYERVERRGCSSKYGGCNNPDFGYFTEFDAEWATGKYKTMNQLYLVMAKRHKVKGDTKRKINAMLKRVKAARRQSGK
jgi:hypothetical protein